MPLDLADFLLDSSGSDEDQDVDMTEIPKTSPPQHIAFPDFPVHNVTEICTALAGQMDIELRPTSLQLANQAFEQRVAVFAEQLQRDKVLFLERYGSHLTLPQLDYFTPYASDYEIGFYLKLLHAQINNALSQTNNISLSKSSSKADVVVRNRRFRYLSILREQFDYFSDAKMARRAPELYHAYIGKHLRGPDDIPQLSGKSSELPPEQIDSSGLTMAHGMLESMRKREIRDAAVTAAPAAAPFDSPYATTDTKTTARVEPQVYTMFAESGQDEKVDMSELRRRFMVLMEERFLRGEDEFDYRQIDELEEWDDEREAERDAEEAYFDAPDFE